MKQNEKGTLFGIGVGPGDPELITLKAARAIENCHVITYLQSTNGKAMARTIAQHCLVKNVGENRLEVPIVMPMCENREIANGVYDAAAKMIAEHLQGGKNVGFLCQGDPLFFGSFCYILERLSKQHKWRVIPGINSISASAATIGVPVALLAENFAVISGRQEDHEISKTLVQFDNVAIMKPGRQHGRIVALLNQSGRASDARYIEYCGHAQQKIITDITTLDHTENAPYFSLFLVNRQRDTR